MGTGVCGTDDLIWVISVTQRERPRNTQAESYGIRELGRVEERKPESPLHHTAEGTLDGAAGVQAVEEAHLGQEKPIRFVTGGATRRKLFLEQ